MKSPAEDQIERIRQTVVEIFTPPVGDHRIQSVIGEAARQYQGELFEIIWLNRVIKITDRSSQEVVFLTDSSGKAQIVPQDVAWLADLLQGVNRSLERSPDAQTKDFV